MAHIIYTDNDKDSSYQIKQLQKQEDIKDYEKYKKLSEQGDAKFQKKLADCYSLGEGVEQSYTEAFKWYKESAIKEYVYSQVKLADCYFFALGVNQNYKDAFQWYKKAAEQKNGCLAFKQLAECYFQGYGVEKSPNKAVEWLEEYIKIVNKAVKDEFLDKRQPVDKRLIIKENANLTDEQQKELTLFNNVDEKITLVGLYKSIEEKYELDISHIRSKLADCYFQGIGVKKDTTIAIEHLTKAADLGNNILAQRRLAIYYFENEVTKDHRLFRSYFQKNDTYSQGFSEELIRSKTELGILYYHEKNYKLAYDCFIESSKFDDALGHLWLAYLIIKKSENIIESLDKNDTNNPIRCKFHRQEMVTESSYMAAACFFLNENEGISYYHDIDMIKYAFPNNIIQFLNRYIKEKVEYFTFTNHIDSPCKIILAYYYRIINNKEDTRVLDFLKQASTKDMLANYILGKHYKNLKKSDKAIHFFKETLNKKKLKYRPTSTKKGMITEYHLSIQQFLIYSAKDEVNNIKHQKKLEEKNQQLELALKEKEAVNQSLQLKDKELNNLIAMFAHNFLGTLQCIRSNAEHDNNPNIHLKTVKMMGGALTAFSIISADDDKLIEQLKQDHTGESNLLQSLANNLALAISQLLSKTNKDKIINLYLNYLKKTQQITTETTRKELKKNKEIRGKWQALQHQWEDEFNILFAEQVELEKLLKWVADNFFIIQITGFDNSDISFEEYGITDSIFLVVFMEILVNALKYMDINANKPLKIELFKDEKYYKLSCENPSLQETARGTHKGIDFLKTIAQKLNGEFINESTENSFKTTFSIPSELLLD